MITADPDGIRHGLVISSSIVICVTAGVLISSLYTITGLLHDVVRELKRLQPKEPWR